MAKIMLRLGAIYVQQLRFNTRMNQPMPRTTLPQSPKDIRTRGPVLETYVGKQTNPDDAVLPMPPHKRPLDLSGDLAKILQQKKLNLEEIVQKGKDNLKEDWNRKIEALILKKENIEDAMKRGRENFDDAKSKQMCNLDNAIQKFKSGEAFPKINLDGIRMIQLQGSWKKAIDLFRRRF